MPINNHKKPTYENRYPGSGQVGQVLAKAFLNEGYEVMLGTRNIKKPEVVKFKSDNAPLKQETLIKLQSLEK
jgi:predicted dinucleotide-binding enzyme